VPATGVVRVPPPSGEATADARHQQQQHPPPTEVLSSIGSLLSKQWYGDGKPKL
jgi:hypothetical protein